MRIRDRPTAPRSSWQDGHAERLIGLIRRECHAERLIGLIGRECLGYVIGFGEQYLRHTLCPCVQNCPDVRTHLSLANEAPVSRVAQALGSILFLADPL